MLTESHIRHKFYFLRTSKNVSCYNLESTNNLKNIHYVTFNNYTQYPVATSGSIS